MKGIILETAHLMSEEVKEANGEISEVMTHLGQPVQEAIESTIFADTEWPQLRGELFRFCQKEYGRCTSFVYIDRGPESHKVGWVFEQQRPFEDGTGGQYTHIVWVTILTPVQCDRGKQHLEPVDFDRAFSEGCAARIPSEAVHAGEGQS